MILDALGQRLDLVIGIAIFCHLLTDLAVRIDNSGVVLSSELITDLGQ